MADAAYAILVRDPAECTGNFFIDDEVLADTGVTDPEQYRADPDGGELEEDIFLGPAH